MNKELRDRHYRKTRVVEIRSMTVADLELLRRPTIKAPVNLKTYRDRHHRMAWLLVIGKTVREVAVECRCAETTVRNNMAAPAFQELMAKYRTDVDADRRATVKSIEEESVQIIADGNHILADQIARARAGEDVGLSPLAINRIVADRMDRFGYSKHTTSESRNVNVNFAANLEAAIARSRKVS